MRLRKQATQPLDTSYRIIPLTKGQVTIVDAADYEWLSGWNWLATWNEYTRSYYAMRNTLRAEGPHKILRMHRVIMAAPSGMQVDHISHDTLDNRRANLRLATAAQNGQNGRIRSHNTTGFKGVSFMKTKGKYRASIAANGKALHIGVYATAAEAHAAYCAAARELHGEFAKF